MIKRQRDTFDDIDFVNNWVGTGAHNLSSLVDPEGDANHPVNSGTSADQVPARGLDVEAQGSASTSKPRFELLDCTFPNYGLWVDTLEQYALSHPATIEITNRSPNGTLLFDVQSYPFPLPKWTKGRYPVEAYAIQKDPPIHSQ